MNFTKVFFVVCLAFAMLGSVFSAPKVPVSGLRKAGKVAKGVIGTLGAIGTGKEIYDARKNRQG